MSHRDGKMQLDFGIQIKERIVIELELQVGKKNIHAHSWVEKFCLCS
ncbi:hypothetical protein Gotur_033508 [Gossypium turneri]